MARTIPPAWIAVVVTIRAAAMAIFMSILIHLSTF